MSDAPTTLAPDAPPSSPASAAPSRLTSDVPWAGLAPYGEADRLFFFGRSRESAELLRIVQRDPFVLLTGAAGVGKTSLLLAGLFPALRAESFLPVLVRIDLENDDRPLSAQILEALSVAAKSEDVDGGQATGGDTLWEAFHRTGQRWWNPRQQVIVPVLVIDQAEELVTLGRETLRRRQRTDRFFEELSQLVENRAPARVATVIENGETEPNAFDFDAAPVRIVFSVREESLAQVRPLRGLFPSMGRSEQRLLPFSTAHAREAIAKPAAQNDLLTEGTADAIVRFLADGSGSENPILPAHLSLLGRELALERQHKKSAAQISAASLLSSPSHLVRDFYERSLNRLPAGARRLIEDHLVTADGQRIALPVEEVIALPEITPEALETLADRCLVRYIPRRTRSRQVELMSDLLCPVVVQSRATWALTVRDETAGRDRAAFEQSNDSLRLAVSRYRKWSLVLGSLAALAIACAAVTAGLWLGTRKTLTQERAAAAQRKQEALAAPLPADAEIAEPMRPRPVHVNPVPVVPSVEIPVVATPEIPARATPAPMPLEPAPEPIPTIPPTADPIPTPPESTSPEPAPSEIPLPPIVSPEPAKTEPIPPDREKLTPEKNEEARRKEFLSSPRRDSSGPAARRAETANRPNRITPTQPSPQEVRKPLGPAPPPPRPRPQNPGSPLR